jgi:beta-lactamase superfamily II metal-dependent hydrolase
MSPWSRKALLVAGSLLANWSAAWAAPPQLGPPAYTTFNRDQRLEHNPEEKDLLRVWMVYVNQGDGLLIQLPPRCNYGPGKRERIEILVDAGSNPTSQANRMSEFIQALYEPETPRIEYAVLSHHDQDHVAGLTHLLAETTIPLERIYHNGLASYVAGVRGFPTNFEPDNAVCDFEKGTLKRGMAFLENDKKRMQTSYLIDDLSSLRQRFQADELHEIYNDLAEAIVSRPASRSVIAFDRAGLGRNFIGEQEAALARGANLAGLSFEVFWPLSPCRKYGDWGETINGNSVVFKLTYGDFEMLFTGDMNQHSEDALLKELDAHGGRDLLECDVLKVPHHGSKHGIDDFFEAAAPVVSVASMGNMGFRSKKVSGKGAWQHPSTDVIRWLGGAHRVYCTEIQEKPFQWDSLTSETKVDAMKEFAHILVETDGEWFRVVEIPEDSTDLIVDPPSPREIRRGNGTRWVRAL